MRRACAMTVLAGLLDDLDLSAQELAEAMREATARTSRDGVGPLTAGMADFLARTTPRGRSKATARKVERILSDRVHAEQLTAQHETVRAAGDLARSLSTRQVAAPLGRATTTVTHAVADRRRGSGRGGPAALRRGPPVSSRPKNPPQPPSTLADATLYALLLAPEIGYEIV